MFISTIASVVGIATAGNALLGDPLGLNSQQNDANAAATEASRASADAQRTQAAISQDQWNYYKTNYQPLESSLIKQVSEAGSPEELARARGAANADVTGAFDTAKRNTRNTLTGYGINPGSPAFQSAVASGDIAEAGAKAGALTTADRNTRALAYSKGLDLVGLGRNIPAQSAASAGSAAGVANSAANIQTLRGQTGFLQSQADTKNLGYGLNSLQPVAAKWFGTTPSAPSRSGAVISPEASDSAQFGLPFSKGGPVKYADGGEVIDAQKTGDGQYDATEVKSVMMKHGLPESVAHTQAHGAAARHGKRYFTPHAKTFASGGGVGLESDASDMGDASSMGTLEGAGTETSDSIPAQIDGQQPAALSKGEFVINADAVGLSGEEMLAAVNEAGLRKRQQHGLGDEPENAPPTFARGGRVMNYAQAGI